MSLPIFKQAPAAYGMPWLRLAFRPFYLGAALLAALIVPLWVAIFLGAVTWQPAPSALLWHAHEMLFGFTIAVIVGFLMTAGKTWTGLPTPRGPMLGFLILLWLGARLASLVAPYAVFAVLDLMLLPTVGLIFLRLLVRSRNWRNVPLAVILLLLSMVNLSFHLSTQGMIDLAPIRTLYVGLGLIVMIESVMAGRVVPFFTATALNIKIEPVVWLERSALAATAFGLILWATEWHGGLTAVVLSLACILNVARQWRWHPLDTLRRPILWILHFSYLWLSLGLGLLAVAQLGWVTSSIGIHALGVGATGGLIMGMMTRTARGHTGRPLAADMPEKIAYELIMVAAVLRVVLPLMLPSIYSYALVAAAAAWSAAFLVYLWQYTPWLVSARSDGKDG
ncbi:MAG: NnrS family protein [Betaproteobacteria bacterium]|nr:NnrS family protein [Betaproteobacteria bacterium]NCP82378.1 NnrS family protein [Rhodoferax sp.]NCS60170.1 NnrS family protein [Rhodoferax sp.]PIZ21688.1 MAG: short-chain dehydrogenase [Comamonadaceae bacterium CG_4_10_14_0_8_um_filter_57_29]PJC15254.1 MAG: short-chain dehydrogenase [Comamonadaceae bacterium CG_4_9_14_0_8_um_filter_57_21]